MGANQAAGYADAVQWGAPLEAALAAHLTSNFYPPLPVGYVGPVLEAIDAMNAGDTETPILLPNALLAVPRDAVGVPDGWLITAEDLVRVTHTQVFCDD
jgi:hypothetical protein